MNLNPILALLGGGALGAASGLADEDEQKRRDQELAMRQSDQTATRALQALTMNRELREQGMRPATDADLPNAINQATAALPGPSVTPQAGVTPGAFSFAAPQAAPIPAQSGAPIVGAPNASPTGGSSAAANPDKAMAQLAIQQSMGAKHDPTPSYEQGPSLASAVKPTMIRGVDGQDQAYVNDPSISSEARAMRELNARSALDTKAQIERDDAIRSREMARQQEVQRGTIQLAIAKQRADFNTLKAMYPTHPLSRMEFDPSNPADYTAALAAARAQEHDTRVATAGQSRSHWVLAGVDPATNQPLIMNTETGETRQGGGVKGGSSHGGASTPAGQLQTARTIAAVSEARLADERMRAFEDDLISGKVRISPLEQAAGSLTTNLADTHSVVGALTQAGSELGLNTTDSRYAQYLRDASTIGRAEQMIMPKGGTETMVRANALLSRAGSGAAAATIDASRKARQSLFGAYGGLEQSFTPERSQQVNAGIDRIRAGDTAPAATPRATPASPAPAPVATPRAAQTPTSKPSLVERVQQLKSMGLSKAAAREQLLHEGYNLAGTP